MPSAPFGHRVAQKPLSGSSASRRQLDTVPRPASSIRISIANLCMGVDAASLSSAACTTNSARSTHVLHMASERITLADLRQAHSQGFGGMTTPAMRSMYTTTLQQHMQALRSTCAAWARPGSA